MVFIIDFVVLFSILVLLFFNIMVYSCFLFLFIDIFVLGICFSCFLIKVLSFCWEWWLFDVIDDSVVIRFVVCILLFFFFFIEVWIYWIFGYCLIICEVVFVSVSVCFRELFGCVFNFMVIFFLLLVLIKLVGSCINNINDIIRNVNVLISVYFGYVKVVLIILR